MTSDSGKRDEDIFGAEDGVSDRAQESQVPEADFEAANANDADVSGFADAGAAADADAERFAELMVENADLKDRMLRQQAEMENLRRRTEREMKDARVYAVSNFARDMLSVADNLRRALDAVPEEARAAGEGSLTGLIEGVEMTEKGLQDTLAKHGVVRLDPENQKFDPNFHQAMFEVPNPDVPNNTVVQVVQAGYAIGERVLRPAMVGVAKGGPKPLAQPQPEAADAAGEDEPTGAN